MITVFKNGRIHTMNREQPYATTLVVEDDRIVYVGYEEGAREYESRGRVVDLAGKMMIPGMIDAHCHPNLAAFMTSGILCDAEMSREETLETIRAYVAEHPEQENYFGIGYPEWVFDEKTGPLKEELDAICADKPMYLMSTGGHEAWCNSKTFEVLHIRETPDPLPGYSYFRRNKDGEPTGQIIETVAQNLVMGGLPWFDTEKVREVYKKTFDMYSTLGVTGLVDCGTFAPFEQEGLDYLGEFEKAGALKQRICSCAFAGDQDRMKVMLDYLKKYHEAYHSDMFNVNTMKIVNDGTVDSCSCAMLEPYPDGSVVEPMAQGEALYQKCVEAAKAGHDIHIHAIGDKAIHETLMAAKAVREAGYSETRITNAHTQVAAAEDIPLFGRYNVLANTSSIWFYCAPEVEKLIGTKRYLHQFELQSIIQHGARMTLGSDYPFDEMGEEPLKGIQMGVTRQLFLEKDPPVMEPAGERLTVEQCLEAYTINAAYCMHMEDKTGSLEVGKYADLVVLEKDLLEMDPHEIMDTRVLLTMLGGKPTYIDGASFPEVQ